MTGNRDYSIIFQCLEDSKEKDRYTWELVRQTAAMTPEIDKLQEIVADTEQYAVSILTTT
ncbi:MAG: hypothetical protein LBO80_07110 [Treponema sp.]|jgi:hypothetical protein|nr:hypothetical protein [Treponema sp.]